MGDVTTDIKTRYSIYVPKPLARINLGAWQKREGASQSPKFGYDGVSIQADKSLFIDVAKSTYVQAAGGLVAHATDWLQCSSKAMTLATADNATVGADGAITVAAGAGQAPTWTLDHGDALETVPYLNLQLHYRVEEVQNSLFEFFRGRREKDDPFLAMDFGADKFMMGWELFKKEIAFSSASGLFAVGPPGAREKTLNVPGKKWDETPKDLRGGFELVAERSWQELFGKKKWSYTDLAAKVAPHDIFAGLKDVRTDPKADLQNDVDANSGASTEGLLKYGFSAYFSRFDPYLLIDPASIDKDDKLGPTAKVWMKRLVSWQNLATVLKRRVDVLYKLAAVVKDNAVMKEVASAAAAVDALYQPIKALRGNVEMFAAMVRQDRGWWGEQVADEGVFGLQKRGLLWQKLASDPAMAPKTKACVRSMAPYKDPGDLSKSADKGFYGGQQSFGGGYRLPGGTQLKTGDTIHIKVKAKDGSMKEYDTPPLVLGGTTIIPATAAKIIGVAATSTTWTFDPGASVKVRFDGEAEATIVLSALATAQPSITTTALASSLFGATGTLKGTTLTVSVDGAADASVTFDPAGVADAAAVASAVTAAFPGLDVSVASSALVLKSRKCGPGASVEVKTSTAATAIGVVPGKVQGATTAAIQAYFQQQIGARATLAGNAITLKSASYGASSTIILSEATSGALAGLGLAAGTAIGKAAAAIAIPTDPKDITADQLVALFNTTPDIKDVVTFTSEDGQVVITSAYEGFGSVVEVRDNTGSTMATALQFLGDFHGEKDRDEIKEVPGEIVARGLDDFDKADTDLQKMPDDAGNLVRPIIVLGKNAVGVVSKAASVLKAAMKIVGLKLPTPKGSIGLIANKGISLGTPDRIVGAGGQGVIFIADGGAGNADHAKYVTFEDTFNRLLSADLFARYEPTKAKESLGFRVFSDTTVDLTGRHTANLLALGRAKVGTDVVGSGVARVGASYAVEVAAQEKVVIGARQEKTGRVEVLGDTVAIGFTEHDKLEHHFGLEERGKTKAWPAGLNEDHAKTSSVFVHAAEQAAIVVGPYMIQLRSSKQQDTTIATAQERVQRVQARIAGLQKKLNDKQLELRNLAMEHRADPQHPDILTGMAEAERLTKLVAAANVDLAKANEGVSAAQRTNDEGVIISVRDPLSQSASNWAAKGKPSIVLGEKGVTITTTTGKDGDAATAVITLDDKGISIKVGDSEAGMVIKKNKVQISDGSKKVVLGNGGFTAEHGKIDFSTAQKITLG